MNSTPLDGGWLGPLKQVMYDVMDWLFHFTGNYGVAIILLTLAIRVLILPLTVKQMKSMKKMQDLQGPMKELQQKYKDQPEKLNQEMMELYRKNGANPMSGCWPTLVQLPFFWALFQMLENTQVQEQFAKAAPFLGMQLHQPSIVLGVFVGAVTLIQNMLGGMGGMPQQSGAQQKVLMYGMPVLFGYFAIRFPAGVALYYVASTLFGFVQQAIYPGFGKRRAANMMAPKGEAAVEAGGEKRQDNRGSDKPRSARTGRKS